MISLKSAIEKIKTLEAEKRGLILEIDELKRTADAKAIALKSEVNALREEIKSLRILMEGSEPIEDKKDDHSEPIEDKKDDHSEPIEDKRYYHSIEDKKHNNRFKRALKDLEKILT